MTIHTANEAKLKLEWAITVFNDILVDEEGGRFEHPRKVVALAYAIRKSIDEFIDAHVEPEAPTAALIRAIGGGR